MSQTIQIRDGFYLAPIQAADKPAYLQYFSDPEIGRTMLALPFPYTESHADWWIAHRLSHRREREIQFGIRLPEGSLIGGIGLGAELSAGDFRAEIGYWLAREHRGRGLMPRVVRVFAHYAFNELGLHKLTATTYPFNPASSRTLEKAGFLLEGRLRQHCRSRDGKQYFDALVFGLLSN